ncbi:hypothetical protein DH2020_023489 [Rehmannia glutinosa]|uniref:tRNA/rRNA methyltransferase SpoU type domain-containing protein n=1 Tax=Rehmannia glutinosa TaxID=99300 RepID=A0ABR0W8S9_REHGL
MDTTGLRALNAITTLSLPLLHFRSRVCPLLRRPFFSVHFKPNSFHFLLPFSTPHFSPLCSSAERCRADALANGFGGAASKVPSNKEFLQVVLVSPQIPGNTGCIARTCAASAVKLHLVEPLGFQVDDAKEGEKRLLAFTKRGTNIHSEFKYKMGDWLVFGSETSGLPPEALLDCKSESLGGGTIRIPMVETYVRCLNLSVSVGIALYEASRQLDYEQLQDSSEPCINSETPFLTEDIFA